jgi:hypothetical protein
MGTIFSHYVRIDIKGNGEFDVWLVEEVFDLGEYTRAQLKWAKECPYNRNGVREKMGWNDEQLDKNPSVLLKHFIERHGDDWFRDNLRPKFIKTRSRKLDSSECADCFLTNLSQHCKKCTTCRVAKIEIPTTQSVAS